MASTACRSPAGPRVALLKLAGEQLDRLVPARLGDLVNGSPVVIGCAGIEPGLEGAANRLDVARAGGVERPPALAVPGHFSSPSAASSRLFSATSLSMLLARTALSP